MTILQHNYLPEQYQTSRKLSINHNYLQQQFSDSSAIIDEIKELVKRGDFTLGQAVNELEDEFKKITKTKYAIGVGSGTDAIFLSLKAIGIDKGDEVITVPYTFHATVGAIATAGATPVFVDVGLDYNMDPERIEKAITSRTKAIVPVHWSGLLCDMKRIHKIAEKYNLFIVEDACHAINAQRNNMWAGTLGSTACFSMHPLKNLNVWGDGGMIVTNSKELHDRLILLRNHGLVNRDLCEVFAYNSRLDTLQAIVGKHLIRQVDHITQTRIDNATYFDEQLTAIPQITIPARHSETKQVFHIYVMRAEKRNELQRFLVDQGVDAKIHYPVPMHLQPAAKEYGYKEGDFPVAEAICKSVISLPVHEFITQEQREFVVEKVKQFYQ
jgi:dTDP-3-amino-2,3,6-trideoxy-4-keto-D-glucose/dTDP-3-amino-3,4,6-trideoxy-alpha-D-glucose/dTDP-2,6-dideoxy-D-kanosamine transaminase